MVSNGRTYLRQRCSGRFYGRRVNCEYVPALPARIVQIFLEDRRKIPYLLVWRSPQNGTVREIVSIAREISRIDPSDRPMVFFNNDRGRAVSADLITIVPEPRQIEGNQQV